MVGSTLPRPIGTSTTPFRFTSLPPELRNEVYICLIESNPILNFRNRRTTDIEASNAPAPPIPLLTLCAVNKQLRNEFLPLWLCKTQHIVPLQHVEAYLRTFNPNTAHGITNIHSPTRHLTITLSSDNFFTRSIGIYTNILPVINLHTTLPSFKIKFAAGIPHFCNTPLKRTYSSKKARAGAEATRLTRILANRNEKWLLLLQSGISKVEVDSWGMVVRIHMERRVVDGWWMGCWGMSGRQSWRCTGQNSR